MYILLFSPLSLYFQYGSIPHKSLQKCMFIKKAIGFIVSCLQMHKKQLGFVSSPLASTAP